MKSSDPWIIDDDKLEINLESPIGNGTFSEVFKGILYGNNLWFNKNFKNL